MSKENTAVTKKKIKRCKEDVVFDAACFIILTLVLFVVAYPLYWVIISSISAPSAVSSKVLLHPIGFTLKGYAEVFKNDQVMRGFLNSLIITFCGVMVNLIVTLPTSYALSRSNFSGKKPITIFYLITMFFGGGMIPSYILIKNLGLMDTLLSLILPSGMAVYYMLLMRAFFLNIPRSIKEAAMIDGAGEGIILFRIVLPLSKPIIATVSLFTMVDLWNSWFSAMLYIKSADLRPLQLCLREIINNSGASTSQLLLQNVERLNTQSYTMAAVMVTMLPIMCVYPFLQKHFVKGIMIGGVKE